MTLQSILALIAGIIVIIALLFLSMIHLFMIPKDVIKKDTSENPDVDRAPPTDNKDKNAAP